jgi:GMP synthase (glutamine-hydrolysing)
MNVKEITPEQLNVEKFIAEQVESLRRTVGTGLAVNALSGGVDSSVVTMIGHRALGGRLKTYFIGNGIMREGEPEYIVELFNRLGVKVELVHAEGQGVGGRAVGIGDPGGRFIAAILRLWPGLLGLAIVLNLIELALRKWKGIRATLRG